MSDRVIDKIRITVVIEKDEKLHNGFDKKNEGFNGQSVIVTHDSSMTLMSTLLKNGLISGSFCGGKGICGRCKIQFLKGITMPTPLERSVMEPEELRQGYRLACLSRPKDDCVIRLALAEEKQVAIISEMINLSENNDQTSQQKEYTENRKAHDTKWEKGKANGRYVVAVDLGTTTIAMQLCDLMSGAAADTYCEMNPQRSYGTDVLSRIQASCEGHKEALRKMVWDVLARGMAQFAKSGTRNILCMCIAGNTAMEHLLLGYDVSSLGVSPFTPVEIGMQEVRYPAWDIPVYIAPGISAFVGGDIVTGLYVLNLLGDCRTDLPEESSDGLAEEAGRNESVRLFIDLGTNGEMAITDGSRTIVTAAAAGPAFEGGAGAQVIGTDMIAVTASLLEQGILDETGLLAEPYFGTGVMIRQKKASFSIENKDIRNLQLAKAAVRAGVEVLWETLGTPVIDQVYLAGGFGYYLDVEAAFQIGLLPERLRGKVQAVGNTSLAGACKLARDLYRKNTDPKALEERLSSIESMNLANQESFEDLYLSYMNLCPN